MNLCSLSHFLLILCFYLWFTSYLKQETLEGSGAHVVHVHVLVHVLSLSHVHVHSLSHTHTHTHTHSLSHFLTHTHTDSLAVEMGRRRQTWLSREDRLCSHCMLGVTETALHFLTECTKYTHIRDHYYPKINTIFLQFSICSPTEKLSFILGKEAKCAIIAARFVSSCHLLRDSQRETHTHTHTHTHSQPKHTHTHTLSLSHHFLALSQFNSIQFNSIQKALLA